MRDVQRVQTIIGITASASPPRRAQNSASADSGAPRHAAITDNIARPPSSGGTGRQLKIVKTAASAINMRPMTKRDLVVRSRAAMTPTSASATANVASVPPARAALSAPNVFNAGCVPGMLLSLRARTLVRPRTGTNRSTTSVSSWRPRHTTGPTPTVMRATLIPT